MHYQFPKIQHIDEIRDIVDSREEFVIGEHDWGYVSNYLVAFEDTFPVADSVEAAVRRELRGIKFYRDGSIAARPYHKFFNLNERGETQSHLIDFSNENYGIMEKLDGSMIHPFLFGDQVLWMTKMGVSTVAKQVAAWAENNSKFVDVSRELLTNGFTPIFEWVGPDNQIVVEYEEATLQLTAIRNTVTGEYMPQDDLETFTDLNPVRMIPGHMIQYEGIDSFIDVINKRKNEEGVVIRFDNGHMLKLKNTWYLQIHGLLDSLKFEKTVWQLILNDTLDDVLPYVIEQDRIALDKFHHKFEEAIRALVNQLNETVEEFTAQTANRKEFAELVKGLDDSRIQQFVFRVASGNDADEVVRRYLREKMHNIERVKEARNLLVGLPEWEYRF